jgi:hypothetical protein
MKRDVPLFEVDDVAVVVAAAVAVVVVVVVIDCLMVDFGRFYWLLLFLFWALKMRYRM